MNRERALLAQLPKGCRVRYRHTRHFRMGTGTMAVAHLMGGVLPQGGKTEAFVIDANGREVSSATALCHPKDNFDRRIGRMVALGRALQRLEER